MVDGLQCSIVLLSNTDILFSTWSATTSVSVAETVAMLPDAVAPVCVIDSGSGFFIWTRSLIWIATASAEENPKLVPALIAMILPATISVVKPTYDPPTPFNETGIVPWNSVPAVYTVIASETI